MPLAAGKITAKDVIIATGSVPFVPPGIEIDGKTVFTSDHAVKLESVPDWVAIIGSGYIGLEFSDVYNALGSEVTFVEAMDELMPGFDTEIGKLAQRILINPRNIDYHTSVLATKVSWLADWSERANCLSRSFSHTHSLTHTHTHTHR